MIVYTHRFKNTNGEVKKMIPAVYDGPFNHQDLDELTLNIVEDLLSAFHQGGFLPIQNGDYMDKLRKEIIFQAKGTLRNYFQSDLVEADGCLHDYQMQPGCGVEVCTKCDEHKGLARCFCGWNLQPGERLEDDVDY